MRNNIGRLAFLRKKIDTDLEIFYKNEANVVELFGALKISLN